MCHRVITNSTCAKLVTAYIMYILCILLRFLDQVRKYIVWVWNDKLCSGKVSRDPWHWTQLFNLVYCFDFSKQCNFFKVMLASLFLHPPLKVGLYSIWCHCIGLSSLIIEQVTIDKNVFYLGVKRWWWGHKGQGKSTAASLLRCDIIPKVEVISAKKLECLTICQ